MVGCVLRKPAESPRLPLPKMTVNFPVLPPAMAPSTSPPPLQIERLGTLVTALGECPVWDADQQRLWLLDCRVGLVHAIDLVSGQGQQWQLPPPIGSMALNTNGRIVVSLKEEVALLDPTTGALQTLDRIGDSHPNLRLNDGAAMPDGSFVVGTMHVFRAEGEAPLGGLYRLDRHGTLHRLAQGLGTVNGPVMHPWNGRLYVADSAARQIVSYAVDASGALHDRQLFTDTSALGSAPDGCCFDAEGGLWTALVHVGAIARFDAQGQLNQRVDLPVAHPASLCFAGPQLDELVVTTIRDSGRLRAEGPLDGAVLRLRSLGVQGAARPRCSITPQG